MKGGMAVVVAAMAVCSVVCYGCGMGEMVAFLEVGRENDEHVILTVACLLTGDGAASFPSRSRSTLLIGNKYLVPGSVVCPCIH